MIYQGKEASILMTASDDILDLPLKIQDKIDLYEHKIGKKINVLDIKYSTIGGGLTAMLIIEGKEVAEEFKQDFIDYVNKHCKD